MPFYSNLLDKYFHPLSSLAAIVGSASYMQLNISRDHKDGDQKISRMMHNIGVLRMRQTHHGRIWFLLSLLVTLSPLICTSDAIAVIRFNIPCSSELVAKAISVTNLETPSSSASVLMKKVHVTFKLESIIRGESQDEFSLDILKNGPEEISEGPRYHILLSEKWICAITKL